MSAQKMTQRCTFCNPLKFLVIPYIFFEQSEVPLTFRCHTLIA